jgi:hypothetical protein
LQDLAELILKGSRVAAEVGVGAEDQGQFTAVVSPHPRAGRGVVEDGSVVVAVGGSSGGQTFAGKLSVVLYEASSGKRSLLGGLGCRAEEELVGIAVDLGLIGTGDIVVSEEDTLVMVKTDDGGLSRC